MSDITPFPPKKSVFYVAYLDESFLLFLVLWEIKEQTDIFYKSLRFFFIGIV